MADANELAQLRAQLATLQRENADLRVLASTNRRPENAERVANIRQELNQMIDPVQLRDRFNRVYRIPYGIFLHRYKNRPDCGTEPKWERLKSIYIGVNFDTDEATTRRNAINKAKRMIERHWELQRQSGTEVEIPWDELQKDGDWDFNNRYEEPYISEWLTIYEGSIRDVSNAPNFNDLPAGGRSWKLSLIDSLNTKNFKLREGLCVEDYLELKICGRTNFRHYNRVRLENELFWTTHKMKNYSTNDIISWIKKYNLAIDVYAFDPTYHLIAKHITRGGRKDKIMLCYMMNNHHIHPIENKALFTSLKANVKSILKYKNINNKYNTNHRCNYQNFLKFDGNTMDINDLIDGKLDISKDMVYFSKDDIKWSELMISIINRTGYGAEVIRPYNKSFIHPVSNQLYQQIDNYNQRLDVCNALYEKTNLLNFKFQNKTIAQLSEELFDIKFGHIPKSSHSKLSIKLLDEFATLPLSSGVDNPTLKYKYHFDIKKCYATVATDILYDKKLPIHTIMDNVELYDGSKNLKCGLYLIDEFIHKSGLRVDTMWMCDFEVKKYLEKGYITYDNIKLQYLARYNISGSVLSDFVKYLFENFETHIANALYHRFYGKFNTKRKRENYAFITESEDVALGYLKEYMDSATYTDMGEGKYLVERKKNERLIRDNIGLYTSVLGGGRMKLLDMIEKFCDNESVVLNAVRVDSIYISSDSEEYIKNNKNTSDIHSEGCMTYLETLKKNPYRIEDAWNPPSKKRVLRINKVDISKYDLSIIKPLLYDNKVDYSTKNICVQGIAGSNKTNILVSNYKKRKEKDKCKVIAHTNVAVHNLIDRGISRDDCITNANFLGWNGYKYNYNTHIKFDILFIDEYSMTDVESWIRINKKVKHQKAKIQAFGDKYQCCAVDGRVKYDITKTQFLKELLGEDGLLLIKKPETMIDDKGKEIEPRCDRTIYNIINTMIEDPEHRIPGMLFYPSYEWIWERHPTAISNTMICKTNMYVDKLNKRLNNEIREGCRVIINVNDKKLDVYNCERYVVKKVEGNMLYLEEWIPNPEIRYKTKKKHRTIPKTYVSFGNASTCYKYQGNTLYESYIIFEPHLMNLQEFITALTRAKKITQIRICNKYQIQNKSFDNVFDNNETYTIDIKPKLKKIQIYLLYEKETNRGYIGITELELDDRLDKHQDERSNCVCKDFNFDKCEMSSLGYYMALAKEENEIEKCFIQDYNKFSDINIINYRENNYNIDLTSKDNREKDVDIVDLSHKFRINSGKDESGSFFYIKVLSKMRKRRYGDDKEKEKALKSIKKVREALIKEHYPSLYENNNIKY